MMERVPHGVGKLYILPHFTMTGTPWLDPRAKGAIVGLTLDTTRYDILRGILEGISYEMALNLHFLAQAGVQVKELRAIGGGAKSPRWLQMKAHILGKTIHSLWAPEAASLGVALLAGYGLGLYGSLHEGVARTVKVQDTYSPDPELRKEYQKRLGVYEKLYPLVKELRKQEYF